MITAKAHYDIWTDEEMNTASCASMTVQDAMCTPRAVLVQALTIPTTGMATSVG